MKETTVPAAPPSTFAELHLKPELLRVLLDAGFINPTPVQAQTIPHALSGADLIGIAQTGTGKTLGFLVPIFNRLVPKNEIQAIVVCPTRELAQQVGKVAKQVGTPLGFRSEIVYGGVSLGDQQRALDKPPDLVVGTPGRLIDFLTSAWLRPRYVRWLVLDEADRMLDMGFIDDVRLIASRVPASRQTMLFSATMLPEVEKLARLLMHEPVVVRIDAERVAAATIEQRLYEVDARDKIEALEAVLRDHRGVRAIVFTGTREATSAIAQQLRRSGHQVLSLSSLLSQHNRERVMDHYRRGEANVLVATDVAGRGIDIDDIDLVINFDMPRQPEDYVHRVGRTGRASRAGLAISISTPRDRGIVHDIERLIGHPITRGTLAGFAAPQAPADKGRRGGGRRRSGGRGGEGHAPRTSRPGKRR